MERLSPLDASFLELEDADPHSGLHIGSVGVFEPPVPTYPEFSRSVAGKLPLLPRYRQKVRRVPLELGRPVWTDDPHFRLANHVRVLTLSPPGDEDQLRRAVGRIMSRRFDRDRPLWEAWVIAGLEGGRWALVSKVHHCLADGISGTDLLAVMLDAEPAPERPPAVDDWQPADEPAALRLVADALAEQVRLPFDQGRAVLSTLRSPTRLARLAATSVRGWAGMAGALRPVTPTTLNGPLGTRRDFAWARIDLADVGDVRHAFGGTVNDVVLAAITGGFRNLLVTRGEDPSPHAVRSLVPVSVRRPGEEHIYDNRVSAMLAELPVHVEDPVQRLHAVHDQLLRLKATHEAEAGEVATSLARWAPFELLAGGLQVAFRLPQWFLTTVTTNVPGPQFPLYAGGRRMLAAFPYVPIADRVRIGIAIFSYCGVLGIGVTVDHDSCRDVGRLVAGIEDAFAELHKAANNTLAGPH